MLNAFEIVHFQLTIKNQTIDSTLIDYEIGGGKAWHTVSLTLPAGQYFLFWEVTYGKSTVPGTSGDPAEIFSAAIDDISISSGKCAKQGR